MLGNDLDFTVNLLGLRDTSNLLFFSSAEERRTFLKCLWGLVIIYKQLNANTQTSVVTFTLLVPFTPVVFRMYEPKIKYVKS